MSPMDKLRTMPKISQFHRDSAQKSLPEENITVSVCFQKTGEKEKELPYFWMERFTITKMLTLASRSEEILMHVWLQSLEGKLTDSTMKAEQHMALN